MDYTTRDVVAYIIRRLGGEIEGMKKLMKLTFLVQYDVEGVKRRAVKYLYKNKPIVRSEFFLWNFGPMSNEVYDAIEEDDFKIDRSYVPYHIRYVGAEPILPGQVRERIDSIVREHGERYGWDLEREVLERLDLTIQPKKEEYMGILVDEYISKVMGIKIEERELHDRKRQTSFRE